MSDSTASFFGKKRRRASTWSSHAFSDSLASRSSLFQVAVEALSSCLLLDIQRNNASSLYNTLQARRHLVSIIDEGSCTLHLSTIDRHMRCILLRRSKPFSLVIPGVLRCMGIPMCALRCPNSLRFRQGRHVQGCLAGLGNGTCALPDLRAQYKQVPSG